jgi:hypothetical protein
MLFMTGVAVCLPVVFLAGAAAGAEDGAVADSWLRARALDPKDSGYTSKGYNQSEHAYLISR